ncbi:MAG: alpha-E domain-containing protein [Maricaulaceae bacterium]|jgi:uncharacterized alpha-E superfamily protein
MLSRTAGNLFWMARYIERSEYVARLLDVAVRMTALSGSGIEAGNEWDSLLAAAGCEETFAEAYDTATASNVIRFMALDADNPSSIWAAFEQARSNARAERTALTTDVWSAINDTWLARTVLEQARGGPDDLAEVIDWVKSRAAAIRGAWESTTLRNDAHEFVRLGFALERADNTARLIDVKYHVLLPSHEEVGGGLDHVHWDSILRAATALRAYQHVYRAPVKPRLVVELMVLRPEMPRSIRASYDEIVAALGALSAFYGGRKGEADRRAGATHAALAFATVDEVFAQGLHEYLENIIASTTALGEAIFDQYMS